MQRIVEGESIIYIMTKYEDNSIQNMKNLLTELFPDKPSTPKRRGRKPRNPQTASQPGSQNTSAD